MAFQEWLDLMVRWSNNWAADLVITALGYPYINGVLREAGFQSSTSPTTGSLFISGSYRNRYKHDDWVAGKELGQLGKRGTSHYKPTTNFVGNALEVARLLTSVAMSKAFGGDLAGQNDCKDMMDMMKHGPGIKGTVSFILDSLEEKFKGTPPISSKIGIGDAPGKGSNKPAGIHDCAIVERTDHGKKLRYVLVVLGGYDPGLEWPPFDELVQGLDAWIAV